MRSTRRLCTTHKSLSRSTTDGCTQNTPCDIAARAKPGQRPAPESLLLPACAGVPKQGSYVGAWYSHSAILRAMHVDTNTSCRLLNHLMRMPAVRTQR